MYTRITQQRDTPLLLRGIEIAYSAIKVFVLLSFVGVSVFPARALAFVNEVELTRLTLVFSNDPDLDDVAIVGIEAFPGLNTVGSALESDSLNVNSTLANGSVIRVLSMAYSSTPGQTDSSPNITASGVRVGPGTLAANFLPFETKVLIGHHTYTVTDRMNSRYNGKYIIDIWKPSRREAINHGAKVLEMKIISIPSPQSDNGFHVLDSLKRYLSPPDQ